MQSHMSRIELIDFIYFPMLFATFRKLEILCQIVPRAIEIYDGHYGERIRNQNKHSNRFLMKQERYQNIRNNSQTNSSRNA